MAAPRIVITGIGGYGRVHLENARRLRAAGRLEIAALVDPVVAADAEAEAEADYGEPLYADLDSALARHAAQIVVVATPLNTHAPLAELAMRAGADVLLEKPPVPTFDEFEHLLAVQAETGRAVQVGFQSLGSAGTDALRTDACGLGPIRAVSAVGLWSRDRAYWTRSPWAGRRTLDGRAVVDGVATNALAHAVATALRIAGYDTAESVERVEVELFRANPIEADDTTSIRITGAGRPTVTCALTLCAPSQYIERPERGAIVTVSGAQASADFSYTTDVVTVDGSERTFPRRDLLENLLDHRESGTELIVPLRSTGAFLRVVEAIRLAPEPTPIDPAFVRHDGNGADDRPVIDDIEGIVRGAAAQGKLFSEVGAPWALS